MLRSIRQDPVESVLAAFNNANLVALGERHWAHEDSQFRLALVRNPAFPRKVTDVVIEFANPVCQPLLDHFVNGDLVPVEELQHVWRDTTQRVVSTLPFTNSFLIPCVQ